MRIVPETEKADGVGSAAALRETRHAVAIMDLVARSQAELYAALFELSQAISGAEDLDSLCRALADALRGAVGFDRLALVLYDAAEEALRVYGDARDSFGAGCALSLNPEDNPAAWVWTWQQVLLIPQLAVETRWPAVSSRLREAALRSLWLLPLTRGGHRLGVLAFAAAEEGRPSEAEAAFLTRVAAEVAVAVDAHLARQALRRERDRLRVLFEITNTLMSKLSWDELLAAISGVLDRVLPHEGAAITVLDKESGKLMLHALHVEDNLWFEVDRTPLPMSAAPSGEVIRSGEPRVTTAEQFDRFPPDIARKLRDRGVQALCSLPLTTSNGPLGTLEIGRIRRNGFTNEELEFAVQVARQIAMALENSLAFAELARMKERLATEKLYLEDEIRFERNLGNMVGQSPAFQALLKSIQIVAPTDATVLILGETGTGKELVARAIHEASPRRDRTFVKIDCGAIPAALLESELFGHEKGAFTGAVAQKMGRFELADGGTLFLDEVGEIPLELQPKLLRAIQDQEFERLGGRRTIRVDVRILAATNRDLKRMVEEKQFRSDLYYRLQVFPIHVPPLRERREDIPLLVRYFVEKYARRLNRTIESIPAGVMDALMRYSWPGNVRELEHLIERSVILSPGPVLRVTTPEVGLAAPAAGRLEADRTAERERILEALRESGGVVGGPRGAAARLGIKRTTLQSRMKKLGIRREYR